MGYHLNCLDEPVFIAVSEPLLTTEVFIIDWRVVLGASKTFLVAIEFDKEIVVNLVVLNSF